MIYAAKSKPGEYHSVEKSNKRGRTEVAVFMSAGRESLWKSKNSVGERSALRRVSYTCSLESCVAHERRGRRRTLKDLRVSVTRRKASMARLVCGEMENWVREGGFGGGGRRSGQSYVQR